jgi:very-short-patch-repair endonuclease
MSAPQPATRLPASVARAKASAIGTFPTTVVPADDVRDFVGAEGEGEHAAAWVARQQLELITTAQLRLAGVGRDLVRTRVRQGTAQRVHRGVLHLGPELMLPGAVELAAALACGDGAYVRRRSAVALLGLVSSRPVDVEIAIVGRQCRARPGISVERVAVLDAQDCGVFHGIPITSTARAILDFAAVAHDDELERAIAEAYALKLVTESELRLALERNPRRAGTRAVRAELDRVGGPQWTRYDGERLMKQLLRKAGLRGWTTRTPVAGFEADFSWAAERLIAEVDGYQYHAHRYAFERDRRRDQAHIATGYTVIRFTMRQLNNEPLRVIAVIATALGAARAARAARTG